MCKRADFPTYMLYCYQSIFLTLKYKYVPRQTCRPTSKLSVITLLPVKNMGVLGSTKQLRRVLFCLSNGCFFFAAKLSNGEYYYIAQYSKNFEYERQPGR